MIKKHKTSRKEIFIYREEFIIYALHDMQKFLKSSRLMFWIYEYYCGWTIFEKNQSYWY